MLRFIGGVCVSKHLELSLYFLSFEINFLYIYFGNISVLSCLSSMYSKGKKNHRSYKRRKINSKLVEISTRENIFYTDANNDENLIFDIYLDFYCCLDFIDLGSRKYGVLFI